MVRWLVDTQLCPLVSIPRSGKGAVVSIPTSAGRTVLDLAMSGRQPKRDILHYLVVSKGLSINDMKDTKLALQTLESLLKGGVCLPMENVTDPILSAANTKATVVVDDDDDTLRDDSVALQDPCALCCDKETDCVLVPCGHQICCTECGHQVTCCPVCKVPCSVLRIFRQ